MKQVKIMNRTIIIEGNSVYELDENCMLKKHCKSAEEKKEKKRLVDVPDEKEEKR
ncbi:MAG: hypothetical protein SOV67_01000 [Bariatricus massiliensis]|nr:hypothetical protein [Bariatricus massiliensis]